MYQEAKDICLARCAIGGSVIGRDSTSSRLSAEEGRRSGFQNMYHRSGLNFVYQTDGLGGHGMEAVLLAPNTEKK